MPTSGIKVLFISKPWDIPEYETRTCIQIRNLMCQIAEFMPDVIVTSTTTPGQLNLSGFETRKKWVHVDKKSTNEQVVQSVEDCYGFNIWNKNPNEKTQPLISVYTGTYNAGDYLRDTYQSLRDQTYPNWEWVVVDDESTDGTWDRLLSISKEDHRVKPFRIKHSGKIGNIKDMATRLSDGEYLVELDHDDMLTDFALEEIKKAFDDPEIGMVYGDCDFIDAQGRRIGQFPAAQTNLSRLRRGYVHIPQQSSFFRADLWHRVGPLDPSFYFAMDYDLWVRIAQQALLVYLPGHTWASFRLHGDAKTIAADDRCWPEMLRVHYREGGHWLSPIVLKYGLRRMAAPIINWRRQHMFKRNGG